MSYIWELKDRDLLNWSICTWSKHVSNSFVYTLGNNNDKAYLPPDYVYVPRKLKRAAETAEVVPVENNNNKKRKVNSNNVSKTGVRKSGKKKATTKQTNTGNTRSVADMFAAAFVPEPAFLERAQTMGNEEDDDDVVGVIEMQDNGDRLNSNSTDPSLLVALPGNTNDGNIPNASRTTAEAFTAAVTTILEAARMDTDNTEEKTG